MKRLLEVVLNAEGVVGGEQKHVVQLVEGLDDSYQATVITWEVPGFIQELRESGIDSVTVGGKRILDLHLIRQLASLMAEGGYDLVHCHGHRAGFIGRMAALRARVPRIVWTCHVAPNKSDANPLTRLAYTSALRYLGKRSDTIIAVSEHLKKWLADLGVGIERVEVIHNCVDRARFRPRTPNPELFETLGIDRARPIVGTVSRLTEQKGLGTLLEAARVVRQRRPDVRFLVVGGGPLEHELKARARALDLEESVTFAGERADIPEVISCFDVGVMTSLWEGFSYVPLEMMASAKAVICSDIPAFREVITDGETGLLFPVGSAEDLAALILDLLDSPERSRELAKAGYALIERKFDLSIMQRRTVGVYERLLSGLSR